MFFAIADSALLGRYIKRSFPEVMLFIPLYVIGNGIFDDCIFWNRTVFKRISPFSLTVTFFSAYLEVVGFKRKKLFQSKSILLDVLLITGGLDFLGSFFTNR